MILGIVPVLFGILGIVFGFIALGEIKRRGQKGRGNALVGVIAGSVWLVIGVVGLTVAVLNRGGSAGTVDIDAVRVGQCFTTAPNATSITRVATANCAEPHTDQLFAKYEAPYTTYPGATILMDDTQSQCAELVRSSLRTSALTDTMVVNVEVPDSVKWNSSHMVACLVEENNDSRWTGSVMAFATSP